MKRERNNAARRLAGMLSRQGGERILLAMHPVAKIR
jgi:hypothetical protein